MAVVDVLEQFHPESILTQPGAGVRMLTNAVLHLSY
jgi:anthranilate/para-aminobenzoate synthase component II